MKCKEFLRNIIPYQENKVNSSLKSKMDAHISKCSKCRKELEISRDVADVLNNVEKIERDEYFWNNLYNDIRNVRIGYNVVCEKYRSEYKLSFWERFLKPAMIGFSFGILLFFMYFYIDFKSGGLWKQKYIEFAGKEMEFYIDEHSLTENGNIFSQGELTTSFVSFQENNK